MGAIGVGEGAREWVEWEVSALSFYTEEVTDSMERRIDNGHWAA